MKDSSPVLSPKQRAAFAGCDLVAFDLDGTLLRSATYAVDAVLEGLHAVLLRYGHAEGAEPQGMPSREAVRERIGQPFHTFYAGLLPQALAEDAAVAEELHREIYARELVAIQSGRAELFDGAERTLAALSEAGYALALISNASTSYFEAVIEAHRLRRFFRYCECLGTARQRPKAAMLSTALEQLGARRAVMVGDKASDFEAALAHGFPSIAMRHGYGTTEERRHATLELTHLEQILELFPERGTCR